MILTDIASSGFHASRQQVQRCEVDASWREEQRERIQIIVDAFLQAWATGDWTAMDSRFSSHPRLKSNQHGVQIGGEAISSALQQDVQRTPILQLQHSNRYIGGTRERASASYYLQGELRSSHLFPGMSFNAAMTFALLASPTGWKVDEVRPAIDCVEGRLELAAHWLKCNGIDFDNGHNPVLWAAREMTLTWPHVRDFTLSGNAQDSAIEAFSRFSWALDSRDLSLLASCFTEDAIAELDGAGLRQGRYNIVRRLEAAATPRAWQQHYADVIHVEVNEHCRSARMVVGRTVPRHMFAPDGMPIYNAYYLLRLRQGGDGLWQFCAFEYFPGWIHMREVWQICAEIGMAPQ